MEINEPVLERTDSCTKLFVNGHKSFHAAILIFPLSALADFNGPMFDLSL